MKTSVLDDLKSIAERHRELHPNSVSDPRPASTTIPAVTKAGWKFKDPKNQLHSIISKQREITLIYKDVRYGYDGTGWYEIQE